MTHRQDQGQPYGEQWPQPAQYDPQAPGWQQPGQYGMPQPGPYGMPPQYQPPRRKRHIVRNVLAGIGAGVVAIVAVAVAASSGHHTVNTTGTVGTGSNGAGHTGGAAAAKTASTGTSITLAGNDNGEQMSVTVTKVITSAKAGDEFTQAPKGDRLYAVQFRLADTGSAAYSDSPENGASVTDSKGQSYDASLGDTAAGCQSFPGTENIASGASGLGCIVFEVPKAAAIKQVQFTLDSGFGPQTGQWSVAR